jgi:beta-ureidopropionase / N-carbamoyl-L-amino-acid hydrolase
VLSFADEEGARYNTPTFGSRALAGRLDVAEVLERADDDGVRMADALAAAGVDPGAVALAPAWLERLAGFVELHIDQSRDLAAAGAPAGAVRSLAARTRLALELHGRADHAGTTRMDERSDALAAAAAVIVRAVELAAADPDLVVTPSRLLVEPNAFSTVPSRARLWLDARGPTDAALDRWRDTLASAAAESAAAARVSLDLAVASRSPAVEFDPAVRAALGTALGHGDELVCFAGHDAGILAPLRPAGMVLVRNPTGISHSPAEEVDLEDAAVAAQAVVDALGTLV